MRFVFGDCDLDTERYELRRAGQVVALEPRAFRVLAYLLRHAGRAVAKQALVQACWPGTSSETISQEYALRNCLMKIRQAVGDAGTPQAVIETVRGYGYRVTAAVTVLPPEALAADTVPPDHASGPLSPAPSVSSHTLPGRRQLTVLRCALVEELAWVRLDPEDVQTVLQAFYTACEAVIQRFDGYIAQYDSTGLLVYFGYPAADEAAAPRAVRAGLMLVEALGRLTVRGAADTPMRLAVRLSIHTGLVVVDIAGMGGRQNPVALGDTPQMAARLQERVAPNTVVVSAATWRLVQGYFTGYALEPQALSGVDVPVQAYQVLGASGAQSRLDVGVPRGLTPLVGREAELALLQARWAQARDGLGQVVVLSGEPGIGKSRLVQVLHEHLTAEPHIRLEWRCAPDAQQSPLQPVIAHLHRRLRWHPEVPPEAALCTLEATLAASGLALPEVVPLVAALLSLPLPTPYPPLVLTPQQQRQRTLEVLLAWLLAETTRHPVLFIVEDLHWSDPSTLEFLTLLIDQGPTARLLTLLTCRPEFAVPWGFRAHCLPLTLNRLPQPQAIEMIGRVAGGKALPPAVMSQIAVQTDGVPLFIEELTKMVLESGLLREGETCYDLKGPLPPLAIPATLHDSLMARLDRLGPVKAVAQQGATIGRTFAYDLLQAVTALDEATLQQGLRQLVETELVYQRSIPPQATYTFKHALIQDTAYQSLLRSTRQQYHQRIAQVVEDRFPETVETQPELLAHHYTEAGLSEQAIGYWQQAGQRASERSAYAEAIHHLTKGLELVSTLADPAAQAKHELALQLTLGAALEATRGWAAPEVGHAYARAQEVCQQMADAPERFRVLYGLWTFHLVRGDLLVACDLGTQLLRLAHQQHDVTRAVEAHFALATALMFHGAVAGTRTHVEESLRLSGCQQDASRTSRIIAGTRAYGLIVAGWALWWLGYPDQAAQRADAALSHAQELVHPVTLTWVFCHGAIISQFRRAVPATYERAEAAIALGTAQGFQHVVAWSTVLLGWALAMQGQGEVGITQMRQGLTDWQRTGAEMDRPHLLALLAEEYATVGQTEHGLAILTEALATAEAHEQRFYEAELYRLKGVLLLAQSADQHAEAADCWHQALVIARHQQARSLELRAAISLSRLWQQQGKHAEAHELLAPIYGWFTEGFDTADLQEARVLLAELQG